MCSSEAIITEDLPAWSFPAIEFGGIVACPALLQGVALLPGVDSSADYDKYDQEKIAAHLFKLSKNPQMAKYSWGFRSFRTHALFRNNQQLPCL